MVIGPNERLDLDGYAQSVIASYHFSSVDQIMQEQHSRKAKIDERTGRGLWLAFVLVGSLAAAFLGHFTEFCSWNMTVYATMLILGLWSPLWIGAGLLVGYFGSRLGVSMRILFPSGLLVIAICFGAAYAAATYVPQSCSSNGGDL